MGIFHCYIIVYQRVTWFLDIQFWGSYRSFGRKRRVFSRFVKTMEVENWVKHDNNRGTHFPFPCTWEDLWKLQACDMFKGWWLMMVQQSGESLGGGVWTTLYISVGMFTTNLNWCGLARFLNYQQWAVPLRYGGPQANYDQYVSWGCSGCHGVPQNLLKIHACRQREEDSDPGNHKIFRFRLRLSVFRGQTFVDGPLVHLSLKELSSVLLSPKSGEEHTHFVRSTVSPMFLPSQPTPN